MTCLPFAAKGNTTMDKIPDSRRFAEACEKVIDRERLRTGIGTYGEKTLHAVLKYYFEPYEDSHEVRLGPFVADIVGEQGVIEIQTRSFDKLRKKLDAFLEVARVTVVYPVPCNKWLVWMSEETGEVTKRRKSPKKGTPWDSFRELYKIKSYLTHPNLTLCVVLVDLEEYRLLNGWSKDRKKGSTRSDRIPLALTSECILKSPADYAGLLPDAMPSPFTTADLARVCRLSPACASAALNVLYTVGAVVRTGKQGNRYLYACSAG